jgi:hypothetical protein
VTQPEEAEDQRQEVQEALNAHQPTAKKPAHGGRKNLLAPVQRVFLLSKIPASADNGPSASPEHAEVALNPKYL